MRYIIGLIFFLSTITAQVTDKNFKDKAGSGFVVIKFTSEWYYDYYNSSNNMLELTSQQISHYQNIANSKSQQWTE